MFKEELRAHVKIVKKDDQARFMWTKIELDTHRPLFICICYFAPSTSRFAPPKGQSPYLDLEEDISRLSREGDVVLLGDFNARTANHQSNIFDLSDEMLKELDTAEMGLERKTLDTEYTEYGKFLLNLGTTQELMILNGLERYPLSKGFTCFPHRHRTSTVDYVMAQPRFIPHIQNLKVGPRPFGVAADHAIISFSVNLPGSFKKDRENTKHRFPTYSFHRETDGIYTSEIYKLLSEEDPWRPLDELT